jgi:hypothetical protein
MNWLKRLLGASGEQSDTSAPPQQANSTADELPEDPRYAAYGAARDAYWSAIGNMDSDMIAYLISPQLMGKPAWPTTRQAYRVIRTADTVIIASDGLTDPFTGDVDNNDPIGFATEVYIETSALNGADFDAIKQSWAFDLIENFAANVANMGGIDKRIARWGMLTMELPAPESMPAQWRTDGDMVGVLINIPPPAPRAQTVALGDGHLAHMVPITIITPAELGMVVLNWELNREPMAAKLLAAGVGVCSDINRASLV